MGFVLNLLSKIFNKVINRSRSEVTDVNISRTENTNAIAGATAAILWICAVVLAIYWISQYAIACYFFVKDSLVAGHLVEFQLNVQALFDMIYSLLGLGAAGIVHQLVKRL